MKLGQKLSITFIIRRIISKMKHCIDCKDLTIEGKCTNENHILVSENKRIKHPEVSWCVNIEIKKEKEKR